MGNSKSHEELRNETPILRYFDYDHLPNKLAIVSQHFHFIAYRMADILPRNAETSTALRKLLEAKDAAVRSALDIPYQ